MTFLNPLNALIPKIPFSFFPDFWVWVTSKARGSVLVGFWGSCQLSPFWGEGPAEGLYRPRPPPETKTRPPQKEEKERKKGKESLWLLEAPVRRIILQMHTPVRTSRC